MATLYYNNAATDADIGNIANWWTDPGFSSPAGNVPTTGDIAVVTAVATGNASENCAPTTLQITGGSFNTVCHVIGAVTVDDPATISGSADIYAASVTIGTVVVMDAGTITATTITFNGTSSKIAGTLIGTVTFNNSSTNTGGTITGNVTLTGTASNSAGITGNVTFTGTGTNTGGTVSGLLTVPGTQSGSAITSNLSGPNLGTFGTIKISGISAAAGGGGGPLGGPFIQL